MGAGRPAHGEQPPFRFSSSCPTCSHWNTVVSKALAGVRSWILGGAPLLEFDAMRGLQPTTDTTRGVNVVFCPALLLRLLHTTLCAKTQRCGFQRILMKDHILLNCSDLGPTLESGVDTIRLPLGTLYESCTPSRSSCSPLAALLNHSTWHPYHPD
jgi:hypothetical protein